MSNQKNYAELNPRALWNDDGAAKVLAMLQIMGNPELYEGHLNNIKNVVEQNEAILKDISKGRSIKGLEARTRIKLEEAEAQVEKAETILSEAGTRSSSLLKEAETLADKIKRDAQRYVTKHKQGAAEVTLKQKQLDALLASTKRENKKVITQRKALEASKDKFEARYEELQKRFEGV